MTSDPQRRAARTNVSFELLDRAVIAGRADEPVLAGWTHARLLEEVAALAGVLHHLGVAEGVPVAVDLEDERDAVVAALATARLGGVVTAERAAGGPVVIASHGSPLVADPADDGRQSGRSEQTDQPEQTGQAGRLVRLVRSRPGQEPAGAEVPGTGSEDTHLLDWDVMLRAGRTDPAAVALVDPGSAYSPGRSVGAVLAELAELTRGREGGAPFADGVLRRVLQV